MRTYEEATVEGLDVDTLLRVLDDSPVELAVLYGSYARGDATDASDVDIAVAFEDSLTSLQRTRARLALLERLGAALGTDEVDVIPLDRAPADLVAAVLEDGILLRGDPTDLDAYRSPSRSRTHEERLEEFDGLLADLERVV